MSPPVLVKNGTGEFLLAIFGIQHRWFEDALATHARMNAFILRVALLAHRKREGGRFPPQLADLVPGVLPSLPKDPFSGGDFGYDSFLEFVYCVGRNRVDEGGDPEGNRLGLERHRDEREEPENDDLTMRLRPR